MNLGYCVSCGKKIPKWTYRNAKFCSEEHRKAYWELLGRRKPVKIASKPSQDVGGC